MHQQQKQFFDDQTRRKEIMEEEGVLHKKVAGKVQRGETSGMKGAGDKVSDDSGRFAAADKRKRWRKCLAGQWGFLFSQGRREKMPQPESTQMLMSLGKKEEVVRVETGRWLIKQSFR